MTVIALGSLVWIIYMMVKKEFHRSRWELREAQYCNLYATFAFMVFLPSAIAAVLL